MNNQNDIAFHEIANIFPLLKDDELADLAKDIKANGLLSPIVTYQGKILDGRNRFNACLMAEIEPFYEDYDTNLGLGTPLAYVVSVNLKRRHLTDDERGEVAAKIANLRDGQRKDYLTGASGEAPVSQTEAAKLMRVSRSLVQRATKVANYGIPEVKKTLDEGRISLSRAAEIAALPPEEQKEELPKYFISQNTGHFEWYTPSDIIEAARRVMGRIDLDPASCEAANEVVRAKQFYTKEDNGLEQEWRGKVWMNPPYKQPLVADFCDKVIHHFLRGEVTEAIVLVNNATDVGWFQRAAEHAHGICLTLGRVSFWCKEKKPSSPLQGQAFLYYGHNPEMFADTFSSHGVCFPAPRGKHSENHDMFDEAIRRVTRGLTGDAGRIDVLRPDLFLDFIVGVWMPRTTKLWNIDKNRSNFLVRGGD